MVSLDPQLAAPAAMALAALGEWLHARRCRRMAHLAFGAPGRPRRWVRSVPFLRVAALGALVWGFAVLLEIDRAAAAEKRVEVRAREERVPHHVVVALDVSPSMHLPDAGSTGRETRGARARALLRSVLERLDLRSARISILAFYSEARPVVVDTFDPEVVRNILDDLPLEHAFEPGKTDLYAAVKTAAELGRRWEPGTATLIVVSDGDTLPAREAPVLPPAFGSVLVLGVGDPRRGLYIDGHVSRQDADSLERLALRLGGLYHDGNALHLPTAVLEAIQRTLPEKRRGPLHRRDLAAWAVGAGSGVLASLAPILALLGTALRLSGARSGPAAPAPAAAALPVEGGSR